MNNIDPEKIAKDLERTLNRHGFSYQFAVLDRADELRENRLSTWYLEGTEIPAGKGNDATHIDFVLFQKPQFRREVASNLFLIAECKRVDPARAVWAFARKPYNWPFPSQTDSYIQFERLEKTDTVRPHYRNTQIKYTDQPIYDLPFDLKTNEKGDASDTSGRSAINNAVAQVLRGTKGFLELVHEINKNDSAPCRFTFLPAIFTTARLFTTDSSIIATDLEHGQVDSHSLSVNERPWLWFNFNRSTSFLPEVPADPVSHQCYNHWFLQFTRTIAIVGPNGIDTFLKDHRADRYLNDSPLS
jgi:hypothetical protein